MSLRPLQLCGSVCGLLNKTGLGPPWESLFGEIRPGVLWAFVLLHNKSPVQSIKEKVDFATQKAEDGIGTGFEEWD